jgi:ABC-2 type transport system ATP-binding protein
LKIQEITGELLNAGWRMENLVQALLAFNHAHAGQVGTLPIISVQGIEKSFGKTKALKGVDLQVAPGTITALLGPNGAGKTTLIRILTTLMTPDKGTATITGHDLRGEPQKIRAVIGLTGQYAAVDERLTGRENLVMVGRLYHLSAAQAKVRAAELLNQFNLTDAADRTLKTYSGGMRRRLDLAASLVNRPQVLFLDEPTTGLDPQNRLALWSAVKELAASGTTIVLTTQYMEEADQLAEHIVVMDKGQIIAQGPAEELKSRLGGDKVEIRLSDYHQKDAAVRALSGAGVNISEVAVRQPSLDEVFLSLTNV